MNDYVKKMCELWRVFRSLNPKPGVHYRAESLLDKKLEEIEPGGMDATYVYHNAPDAVLLHTVTCILIPEKINPYQADIWKLERYYKERYKEKAGPDGSEITPAVIAQIVRETPDELKGAAPVDFLEKVFMGMDWPLK